MACQCTDFLQSYVAVSLAIAASNFFHNSFYHLDPYSLKLIIFITLYTTSYYENSLQSAGSQLLWSSYPWLNIIIQTREQIWQLLKSVVYIAMEL